MIRIIQQRPDGELLISIIRTPSSSNNGASMKKRADELLPGDRIRPYPKGHPSLIRTVHLCSETERNAKTFMLQFSDDPGMPIFPRADYVFEVEA